MKTLLRNQYVKLRASLWFIPFLMAMGAVALAALVAELDERASDAPFWVDLLSAGSTAGGQAVLSTIAGGMIGVAGVVFSITIVALQLASSQFGPRLLRNFMKDTTNQVVLGTFLATFIYCLLGLRRIDPGAADASAPEITVAVALALALVNMALLITFIHHIATSIQADSIIATVGAEMERAIENLYPEEIGMDAPEEEAPAPARSEEPAASVRGEREGYLQAVDHDDLLRIAERHDLLLRLACRPGDFLTRGERLLDAHPAARVDAEVEARLRRAFIFGRKRTEEQDVEFSVDQLVEVACRSLSPGINDPFTALTCVDRLGAGLSLLAGRRFPSAHRLGKEGKLRVIVDRPDFEGVVSDAFDQIRQYGRGSVAVTIRLLEAVIVIAPRCRDEERRRVLARQVEKIVATSALARHAPQDVEDIERRRVAALEALGLPAGGSS